MEFKVIVYIIIGIIYFIYSIKNKAKQTKENSPTESDKPVSPPVSSWEDILKELQKKQEEATTKQQPQSRMPTAREFKGAGAKMYPETKPTKAKASDKKPAYKGVLTEESNIERGTLVLENEGVYKVESIQEMEAREKAEMEANAYRFDAREALIGSIVMERKF